MTDAFSEVEKLLEAGEPKAWMWGEDGNRVVGTLVSAYTRDTQYQQNCPVVVLMTRTGEQVAVWGTGVLEDKLKSLEQQGLAIGDTLGIERSADKLTSKTGAEYWGFQVARVPGPNARSAGMFGGRAAAPALPVAFEEAEVVPTPLAAAGRYVPDGDDWT